ncbi:hypothetical protein Leryth_010517 [Lithospermum erythrorhizon]|uniref:Uncharacterized protein n=1 Tax=Lithospermum erythrorhizon TaxID=34254 RepID=A0AAV3RD81_LITER|nr:hypothetical protein Leryth_010517 [Lithospermum erythrorhizon]
MAENSPRAPVEDEEIKSSPDVNNVAMKIQRAGEVYKAYAGTELKPTKDEIWMWCLYGLCSYFIHTVLIPIIFPLIVSQTVDMPPEPKLGWLKSLKNLECSENRVQLYQRLVYQSIFEGKSKDLSPLGWTSISWAIGLVLVTPAMGLVSVHLDYGKNQQLIAGAATAVGGLFCLPAGFFKTWWIFPPYIAAIVAAYTVSTSFHARYFGLMLRGFVASPMKKSQFPDRKSVAGWLSLYSTAAGCLGSGLISAFTYHMLRKSDHFTSLWVVSIFSGLFWFIGMSHIFTTTRPGVNSNSPSDSVPKGHVMSIFNYPHAAGSLAAVFLSSFTTMCIFTGAVLYALGALCLEPVHMLYTWLTYFLFPLLSLPLAHPLARLIKADAVKMQLLGFVLSTITSGFGFYYRHSIWNKHHIMGFAAIQSTGTGLLHAFSRVLLLDCSPAGKEGAFSVWFSWVRSVGACAGFAFASAYPANNTKTFALAFCAAVAGMISLVFGNISNSGGAKAAGHIKEQHSENSLSIQELDYSNSAERGTVFVEATPENKLEV